MNLESCPAFSMNNEEIVDVFYIPFEKLSNGNWAPAGITTFYPTGTSTHIVVELPVGCFQWNVRVNPGETVNVHPGNHGGYDLVPCQRVQARESVSV